MFIKFHFVFDMTNHALVDRVFTKGIASGGEIAFLSFEEMFACMIKISTNVFRGILSDGKDP